LYKIYTMNKKSKHKKMVHLSSPVAIGIMTFYSLITFFIAPMITTPLLKGWKDPCPVGFTVGFIISIILWKTVGRKYVEKHK